MPETFFRNSLSAADIVSVQFTLTRDLDVFNPCAALRANDVGIDTSHIPLFCSQEAYIKGGLEKSSVFSSLPIWTKMQCRRLFIWAALKFCARISANSGLFYENLDCQYGMCRYC